MVRHEEVRFKMLRNGAEYAEIYPYGSAPTLRCDSEGAVKMSLKGTFLAKALDVNKNEVAVNWMTDEIQVILTIDGIQHSLGILIPTTVTPAKDGTTESLSIQAYDRCWVVKDTCSASPVYLNAGDSYVNTVESLLVSSGIGLISKSESDAVLPEARQDWDAGESYLKICNDLLSEINYKSVWFNSDGIAVLEPVNTPIAENIQHTMTNRKINPRIDADIGIISVTPTFSSTTDIYSMPNVFLCVCSNADKSAGMRAISENTNPQSPLSINRRGRRITKVVSLNNIASQDELQAYADRLRNESMFSGEVIQVKTLLQPGFGVEDVTALEYDDLFSICLEKAWEMQLAPGGLMTHKLKRVVLNIG